MKPQEILKTAVLAGEILLKNGAETHRVEDTMERILQSSNFQLFDSFVTTTGIFASAENADNEVFTVVRRIKVRTTHLGKVADVNNISRKLVAGEISCCEAHAQLLATNNRLPYKSSVRIAFSGLSCFGFTYMFGGTVMASVNSLFIGFALYTLLLFLNNRNVTSVLVNLLGGAMIALAAVLLLNLRLNTEEYIHKVIIGSLMPLVPGLGLTNAIRDIMAGDLLSGISRTVDAVIVAVSIAIGVGLMLRSWLSVFGGFWI